MSAIWKLELRRLFHSKALYFSLAAGIALDLWLLFSEMISVHKLESEYALYGDKIQGYLYYPQTVFNQFMGLEYEKLPPILLYTTLPLLVTLPYAASYFQDRKSGYLKQLLVHVNRKSYYLVKLLAVFFSGIFVSGVILLCSLGLTMLLFPMLPPESVTANYMIASDRDMWVSLFYAHPMLYTLCYIGLDMLFCGCFAAITLFWNLFTNTLFFSLTGSFLCFEILDYVLQSVKLSAWSPLSLYLPSQRNGSTSFGIVLLELMLLLLLCFVPFYQKERKKDVF